MDTLAKQVGGPEVVPGVQKSRTPPLQRKELLTCSTKKIWQHQSWNFASLLCHKGLKCHLFCHSWKSSISSPKNSKVVSAVNPWKTFGCHGGHTGQPKYRANAQPDWPNAGLPCGFQTRLTLAWRCLRITRTVLAQRNSNAFRHKCSSRERANMCPDSVDSVAVKSWSLQLLAVDVG